MLKDKFHNEVTIMKNYAINTTVNTYIKQKPLDI